MPLFSFNRNSDGGLIREWYYGEMAAGKALSDAPIPTGIQQQEVEEHDFVAKAANSPIHASIKNDGKYLPPNFKNLLIRSFPATAWSRVSDFLCEIVEFSQMYLQVVCASLFMLVLDLDGNIDSIPDAVGDSVHLRHLRLHNTFIKKLPHAIGNLQKLHTLEVTHANLHQLPEEILNIIQLRHL
ncbi:hypothetical protein GH714_041088 [Hevea brasiliensis]|uniref:Disease resistance R13L4/SHOC-2-like LRR domain-containing protein n=1 Tax=Hevea brasiliensis TaxID=3981 RepID=A0A6A6MSW2_HEVBR|nr:hypothetical protein GH714_041088 [Hevea brasiliensis]